MNEIHAPEAGPLLSIRGLSVSYDRARHGKPVLNDFSLDVAPGEAVGVVGESGSGKTTLAKAILGAAPCQSGSITFAGQEIARLSAGARRTLRRAGAIQYVFQDPLASLDPQWSVWRCIEEMLLLQGAPSRLPDAERIGQALDRVGLSRDLLARLPGELSGGQRQRVVIARALVSEPRLLIADEPVSALDASARSHVLSLFADLRSQSGIAQLFISHDLGSVASLVNRIVVLHGGQIVESGPPSQVIGHPVHPYTRDLVRAAPRLRR